MSHPHSPNGQPTDTFSPPPPHGATPGSSLARSVLMLPIRLFSSIWLGITLLTLLFIYSSIGSAGVPKSINIFDPGAWVALRQWRPFEMTEFEWFHWWPFSLLIGLICLNIIVATLRRIPFNAINCGVWMIHSGILTLCAGSMWYFGVKVEGDSPVNRRLLTIRAPGSEPTSIPVIPGNRIVFGKGNDQYALTISSIDPQWEILSGDDTGKRVYSVNVEVQSATGIFIRQLLAGYPQYTDDVIRNPNPTPENAQPMVRAIKAIGKPLVDEALELSLAYDPQQWFYLIDSRAVYLREIKPDGTPKTNWVQRPIKELPRYNDYIASSDDAWLATGQEALDPAPINVQVPPVDASDPLPNTTLSISGFLRYAQLETRRRMVADGPFDPVVRVRITSPQGRSESYDLAVADPKKSTASNGKIAFVWINSPEQLEALIKITEPMLRFSVPGTNIEVEAPIRQVTAQNSDLPFTPIARTEYSYRVQGVQDSLNINNRLLSVAIVEFKSPQKSFTRWVFDDPKFNRDLAQATPGSMAQHEADIPLDAGIETTYQPGHLPPAPVMIVGGPGENDLTVVISLTTEQKVQPNIKAGDVIPIAEGITLDVLQYAARTVEQTKPSIIAREQRDRDAREFYSMIHVDVPADGSTRGEWLPYNLYAFAGPEDVLRRFPYRPVFITMPDGRRIEMMFARQRMALPAPVALDDFKVASHIGGFTGQTSSVMDWTSMISFNGEGGWTAPVQVSVNKPAEHMGYWYFQAQWDPPEPPRSQGDPGTRGLNYTVLGVGNREGVWVQLAGCCIAVLGMIYTFYGRPFIKRRRQQRVYTDAARSSSQSAGRRKMDAMVAVLEEDHT